MSTDNQGGHPLWRRGEPALTGARLLDARRTARAWQQAEIDQAAAKRAALQGPSATRPVLSGRRAVASGVIAVIGVTLIVLMMAGVVPPLVALPLMVISVGTLLWMSTYARKEVARRAADRAADERALATGDIFDRLTEESRVGRMLAETFKAARDVDNAPITSSRWAQLPTPRLDVRAEALGILRRVTEIEDLRRRYGARPAPSAGQSVEQWQFAQTNLDDALTTVGDRIRNLQEYAEYVRQLRERTASLEQIATIDKLDDRLAKVVGDSAFDDLAAQRLQVANQEAQDLTAGLVAIEKWMGDNPLGAGNPS